MKDRLNSSAIGTWLALICAVHCALTPLVISVMPLLAGSLFHAEWLEILLMGSGFAIGGWALWSNYRGMHGQPEPFMIGAGGGVLFILGYIFLPHSYLHFATFAGAALLVVAHIYNLQLRKKCNCAH